MEGGRRGSRGALEPNGPNAAGVDSCRFPGALACPCCPCRSIIQRCDEDEDLPLDQQRAGAGASVSPPAARAQPTAADAGALPGGGSSPGKANRASAALRKDANLELVLARARSRLREARGGEVAVRAGLVSEAPVIRLDPSPASLPEGSMASFKVAATVGTRGVGYEGGGGEKGGEEARAQAFHPLPLPPAPLSSLRVWSPSATSGSRMTRRWWEPLRTLHCSSSPGSWRRTRDCTIARCEEGESVASGVAVLSR